MNFYFISPIGRKSDYLYDTFVDTFIEKGHQVVDSVDKADCVFYDLWCGWGEYNPIEIAQVLNKKLPVVVFDFFDFDEKVRWQGFYNFFENVKHEWWALNLLLFFDAGLVKAYFMRKMLTTETYPSYVYPIECIQYPDHDFPLTTMEELSSRPYDACFIGAESPRRKAFIESLQKDGRLKLDIQFTTERIPHEEWLNRHRRAKFFISADGGGLSDERAYQLMPLSTMLRQKNNQKLANPWTSLFDCVQVGEEDGVINSDDIEMIVNLCKDQDYLYQIYLQGNHTLKKYFNPTYRANYILNILKENGIQ